MGKSGNENGDTPLMQQHRLIKQKYPDAILLFRVGDFYETFGEDAIVASKALGITLTKRNNGAAFSSELAGFPYHSLDTYLHKLVKAGYRVAVCDQLEDPKMAKGIVKRGVTEIVTPGLATHDKLLEHNSNNFLAAIHFGVESFGMALLDISTGEFFIAEGDSEYVDKLLQTFKPSEIIFQRNNQKQFKEIFGSKFYMYSLESWVFDEAYSRDSLLKHFQTHSLKGFGVEEMHEGIVAAGAILHYLKDTEHPHLQHISSIQRLERDDYLWMDKFTIRNLELIASGTENGKTLLSVLDNTVSPMGARLLKRWMVLPLKNPVQINERLELVEFLIKEVQLRDQLTHHIKQCGDIERLVSKIPNRRINPREVVQIAQGLIQIAAIQSIAESASNPYLKRIAGTLNPCLLVLQRISREIIEHPPATAARGGIIQKGVSPELDELQAIESGGKQYVLELQQKEAAATGISSLKIGFNNIFGYYLEVTNAHKGKTPPEWIRKQTLANAERYITTELKEYEEKITGAGEKILALELELYEGLLSSLEEHIPAMQINGHGVAVLDCILCFANNALRYHYKKPELHNQGDLDLKGSRHPVIERNLPPGELYISNDIFLSPDSQQIIILTGPNMSGKSALLRQTALITLLGHMGSFVPADSARIPMTDRIFTRVGASDNLSGGESTFMVEMNETASILNNITARSLILLDEIGRGTSTYDGISIAWSITEFLHGSPFAPKTLFATHYHELNELESKFSRVKNYHITNKEVGNKVIFLRKLAPGGSTHSFGIHVAKMAGMPASLIQRANEMLKHLEETREGPQVRKLESPQIQLTIFDAYSTTFEEIRKLIKTIDIDQLTPLEALKKLDEIKKLIG